jgi:hypothetical protein
MKILRIDDNKGFFSIDEEHWEAIDEIDKAKLMALVDLVLESSVQMDEYSDTAIGNQAHQIIYKSIYEKLNALRDDKDKFRDESDRLYQDSFEKYQQ